MHHFMFPARLKHDMRKSSSTSFLCWICLFTLLALAVPPARAQHWPEWRGPRRDGLSPEKKLPETWSPKGENLLWRVPYGGRSGAILLGDRLYVHNTYGQGAAEQERVMCFDSDTGKVLWEKRFTVYNSDIPAHRTGWAAPAGDPATGNIYVQGGGGLLTALSRDGKILWQRELTQEFGLITTHGGRTTSPMVESDMVLVSGPTFGWGAHGPGSTKFYAFDKHTGEVLWASAPGGRPTDTTYSPLTVAEVNATRLLITGASDGAIHALKLGTGEPVWNYMMSKRGINTGVLNMGHWVYVSHSEENFDTSEMGSIAAIDAASTGAVPLPQTRWRFTGYQVGYSSPVTDGKVIYQVDNGAILFAFDAATGAKLWQHKLGTIQKASPVLADGKLYVGTENGKFFILRPRADGVDVLSEVQLGTEDDPEEVLASVAVSRGRIFLVTTDALYAIGKKAAPVKAVPAHQTAPPPSTGPATFVQILPTEIIAHPGDKIAFRARLYDAHGRFIREERQVTWAAGNFPGSIAADGVWTIPADARPQGGEIKGSVGNITGTARVRIIPPLPWSVDVSALPLDAPPSWWMNATGKYAVKEWEGKKYVAKSARIQHSFYTRARTFLGPIDLANYTIEADVRSPLVRRQLGDIGVVAQGYTLYLFGVRQKLEIQSWMPETERIVSMPFSWKPDTWYRMKLRVENLADGSVHVRGKVWPAAETEPAPWTIEKVDPIGPRSGSPGLFGNSSFDMLYDNIKVYSNSASK
jgi:outer membrane protein assembly factor BamB